MKYLSDWMWLPHTQPDGSVINRRCRLVELTEEEKARSIPLLDFLRDSKQDPDRNNNQSENIPDSQPSDT